MFMATFVLAIQSIFRNKVRSFLTMLGIIIGVGSVVLLTSIGNGLQAYVSEQFEALGSNTIYVVPGQPFGEGGGFGGNQEQTFLETTKTTLKSSYLRQILRNNRELISDGAATNFALARAKYLKTEKKVTLLGVSASYAQIQSAETSKGEWFTEVDEKKASPVLLLGIKAAEELFGEIDPVGKRLQLDSQTYTVVGVLKQRGGGFGGPSFDNYLYLPFNTIVERFDVNYIDNFIFSIRDSNRIAEAKRKIETELLDSLKEDEFTVFDQTQLLDTINSILGVLTAGLGGIAAISLVVGGIGIMNIMLVSVTERTREIGLRKALGATPNIILVQFLIEAALLSAFGGLIGLLIAYVGSLFIQQFFPAKITLDAVLLAVSVSTIVGLVFGAAPARRAALLSPIEALRYE